MTRPNFKPTDQQRRLVRSLAMIGMPPIHIAPIISISPSTLMKYFAKQIELGIVEGNAKVAHTASEMASSGKYPSVTRFWRQTIGESLDRPVFPTRKGPLGKMISISKEAPTDGEPYTVDRQGRYIQEQMWSDQRRVDDRGNFIKRPRQEQKPKSETKGDENGASET